MIARLLRDRLYQSFVGVMVVLLLAVAYLLGSVLDMPLTSKARTVQVEMAATGGLFEGSSVTYRGVKVGKVKKIRLSRSGVVATISLTSDERIPTSSIARVRSLSPVGEQYLDFQPKVDHGPYLRDGSVVPAAATDLPKTLASTVISVNKLLDQVDSAKLHTLLTELSTGLAGTGQDIGRMVDQGQQIIVALDRLWPETSRLLTNAGTVLDIGIAKSGEIRQLAISARQFAAFLKDYDPQLRTTLQRTPGQIDTLQGLVRDASRQLPGFLGAAVRFTDLFMDYQPHLRGVLTTYSSGLGVLGRAVRNGALQIEGIPQRSPRCDYGTHRQPPRSTVRQPLNRDGHCPGTFERQQRGAAHAPGPERATSR